MTREELVEAVARDLAGGEWLAGPDGPNGAAICVDCGMVSCFVQEAYRSDARRLLATHAPAIIRLAVEGYMAGTGKPGAHGVTLYLTEELLADGLVRAWERGKTT